MGISSTGWWFWNIFYCSIYSEKTLNWPYFPEGLRPPTSLYVCLQYDGWCLAGFWLREGITWFPPGSKAIQLNANEESRLWAPPLLSQWKCQINQVWLMLKTHTKAKVAHEWVNDSRWTSALVICCYLQLCRLGWYSSHVAFVSLMLLLFVRKAQVLETIRGIYIEKILFKHTMQKWLKTLLVSYSLLISNFLGETPPQTMCLPAVDKDRLCQATQYISVALKEQWAPQIQSSEWDIYVPSGKLTWQWKIDHL